ncbi:TonB-dependent receptor [Croceibacterium soli]|nr:TonB-dependent receptor [Croceibacterium soli]
MRYSFARALRGASTNALIVAAAAAASAPAFAQAPETQSSADPAPAEEAAAAQAGDANSPGPQDTRGAGVEEIIVTAQFREQNLQETPLAITAVSAAMLEARSQTTVADIASQAPSVSLKSNAASYGPSLAANIRGVGQFDFHPALEPGVGLYVDDVYYSTLTGSIIDLLDLERVEILRGPQGTLAGKNSIGGAVKLYSKRPTGDGSGYVQAAYGSRDRLDLRASVDFALAEDVYARMAGVARSQEGYVDRLDYGCVNPGQGIPATVSGDDCVLSRQGDVGYQAVRGQLRFLPTNDLEINIIGDFTRDDREIAGSVLTFANYTGAGDVNPFPTPQRFDSRFICRPYCNYSTYSIQDDPPAVGRTIPGRVDFTGWGVSGQAEWDLSDSMQLVSITAYRAYESIFSNEDDLSPMSHQLGGPNSLDFSAFSQELRLNGSLAQEAIDYTVGGFYMDQDVLYSAQQDLRYVVPGPLVFVSNDPVPAFTKAVFGHLGWNVTDQLTLTGGIRYTEEGKDYTYSRLSRTGQLLPGQNALLHNQTGRYRGSRTDYRAAVQYELNEDIMAYGQFSTGFKGGGVNPRPFAVTQIQPFGPETLETWEVGLKTDLFDRALRFNVAAFTSKYNDIQLILNRCPQFNPPPVPPTAPFPCGLPANVGSADIKGVEVEANLRPAPGLLIDSAVSYLDFQYSEIDPQAGGPTNPGGVQLGMRAPYTPEWKWSVGAQYEILLGGAGSLTPRFDAAYQSDVWGTAVNVPHTKIEDYVLANARLTWLNEARDLQVSLEVTNLFDEYYFLTTVEIAAAAGVASAQPGRPREWALTLKKEF